MRTTVLTVSTVVLMTLACGGDPEVAVNPPADVAPTAETVTPAADPAAAIPTDMEYYFTREITAADLDGKSLRERALMRNTIYARAGNPFRKKWLNDYFSAQPWYHPEEKMDSAKLTPLDLANAQVIGTYEATLPRDRLTEEKVGLLEQRDAIGEAAMSAEDRIELQLVSAALGEWEGDPNVALGDRNPLADPNTLTERLTEAQLADLSRRDLRILRNTIFARYGRAFKSEQLQAYFSQKVWYELDPAYSDDRLNDVDKDNIAKIVAVEESLGGKMTDAEQKAFDEQSASMSAA
jgi:hypothetical protein